MAELRIAVVGDSAMWGQGLVEADKYWLLATGMIRKRLGSTLVFKDNIILPRSGAKIFAAQGEERPLVLPSGRIIRTKEIDRAGFIDTYPEVFVSEEEMIKFLDPDAEDSEEPARCLFGEIPSTFPTITYQVKSMSQQQGERVDLLFLNGGANDIDFESFLHPEDHSDDFRKTYQSSFMKIFYTNFKKLIGIARRKCPNAVIVATGYYSALAPVPAGDFDGLKEFFLSHASANIFSLGLNWFVNQIPFVDIGTDIPVEMSKAKERSHFGSALGLYWTRKVMTELNEDSAVRGAGLIFVPSGFKPENGIFARNSLLHGKYEADKVDDRAKAQRVNSYPRKTQIPKMLQLWSALIVKDGTLFGTVKTVNLEIVSTGFVEVRESLQDHQERQLIESLGQELRGELKGPRRLIEALDLMAQLGGRLFNGERPFPGSASIFILALRDRKLVEGLVEALNQSRSSLVAAIKDEVSRFNHVQIASFIHPNEAGAQQYANNIVARFDRHRQMAIRENIVKLATSLNGGTEPPIVSVKDSLKRYGLDPTLGLRTCMQNYMIVDSIAVEISTRPTSDDKKLVVELSLAPNQQNSFDLTYLNNVERVFRPGSTDLIPLDTFGEMHLSMIKQLKLVNHRRPGNPTWSPSSLKLFINGKEVFRSAITKTFSNIDDNELILPYPR